MPASSVGHVSADTRLPCVLGLLGFRRPCRNDLTVVTTYDALMDGQNRRSRLRSFALGGAVGIAGTIATARRLRQPGRRSRSAGGLGAFEDAPCFLEVVGREAQRYREGAEIGGERNE
jgi:hypothetical protein